MGEFIVILVWLGGANWTLDNGGGIWAALFWPYRLGRLIAALVAKEPGDG